MSVLPLKADIRQSERRVRHVPLSDTPAASLARGSNWAAGIQRLSRDAQLQNVK